MSHYFAFVALVAVLVLIPGPAVILVMQKAVTTGYRGALRVAAGVLVADLEAGAPSHARVRRHPGRLRGRSRR
jgi:threonine/homoserine/homoserine lactone efflux protein